MENFTCEKVDISGDGGLVKELIQAGVGYDTPTNGCRAAIHFTGKLTDGTIFDSSLNSGEPIEFTLGKGMYFFFSYCRFYYLFYVIFVYVFR